MTLFDTAFKEPGVWAGRAGFCLKQLCAVIPEEHRMGGGGCPASGTSGEPRMEESLLKGSTGQELTSAGRLGGNFLHGDVHDSLLVCHGPHIVLSSVPDLCVRNSIAENE